MKDPMLRNKLLYLLTALLLSLIPTNFTYAQSDKKVAYGILLDNTRSLEKQFPQVLMLGQEVVKRIYPRGPVSLFNFAFKHDEVSFVMQNEKDVNEGGNRDLAVGTLGVKWSQDENTLARYIQALSVVKGHTSLLKAVQSMADEINAKVNTEKDAFAGKTIILITDGEHRMNKIIGKRYLQRADEDDERRKRASELIKALKGSGIRVYAVGLTRELDSSSLMGASSREKAENFLRKITKETGGRVIFPNPKKMDITGVLNELLAQ